MPELIRHETARDVFLAYLAPAMAEVGDVDPDSWYVGGVDAEGRKIPGRTATEAIADIEEMGLWGFTDTKVGAIHYWIAPLGSQGGHATFDLVLSFSAHELAHAADIRLDPSLEAAILDEVTADAVAAVAVAAYSMARELWRARLREMAPAEAPK